MMRWNSTATDCLRIDSVPKQNSEKAEDVFKFVKSLIEEVPDFEIPEVVYNRQSA